MLAAGSRYQSLTSRSYMIHDNLVFLCICDQSYPRKLAFTYLSDLQQEFTTTYPSQQYLSPTCRPFAFIEFDTFIQRTKKTYQDSRASMNLDKLNDELKDVTKVMTKNIEDLLYRGDSLERMGEMSGRLREDSRKYKRAAVRINWELLLKQVRHCQQFRTVEYILIEALVWAVRRPWVHHDCIHLVALLLIASCTAFAYTALVYTQVVQDTILTATKVSSTP